MDEDALWMTIWRANTGKNIVTAVAIGVLTLIFFFQTSWCGARRCSPGCAAATWCSCWCGSAGRQRPALGGQRLTFRDSLLTGFTGILPVGAADLPAVGGGGGGTAVLGPRPFCGWLCPFGALQELLNNIAQALKVPQFRLPWGLHERLCRSST